MNVSMIPTVVLVSICSILPADQKLLNELHDQDLRKRISARKQLRDSLRDLEDELLVIVKKYKDSSDEKKQQAMSAIKLLGDVRSKKAVALLIELIDLRDDSLLPGIRRPPTPHLYPALGALAKIGDWRSVVKALAETDDRRRRSHLDTAVVMILGYPLSEAAIQQAMAKTKDAKQKQRLQAVLDNRRDAFRTQK